MANGGAVTLDTVMIKVESDAGKANANIGNLANTLRDLKSATAGGFNNIKKLGIALQGLRDGAKGLGTTVANLQKLDTVTNTLSKLSEIKAPSGLRQVIKRLNELSETSKTLYTTAYRLSSIDKIVQPLQTLTTIGRPTGLTAIVKNLKALNELGSVDSIISEISKIPQIVEPLNALSQILDPKGFKHAVENLGKLPEIINKFDTQTFENLKRVSNELAQSLTPLADKMRVIADGYSAFSKIQNTFGKSASTTTRSMRDMRTSLSGFLNIIKSGIKNVISFGKSLKDGFGKSVIKQMVSIESKIKQIALSLLGTRTIFTMTRKAISEYQAFDQTLQKFSTNIWRAFGAQLAPIVEYVMELFKQFVRVIYSFVYAITGIDLIAKANAKAMASWGKDAEDALGSLQKFDDLNVVEFPKSEGADELIQMDKIDLSPIQKVIDWVRKLKEEIKEALDTGQWENVGIVFANGINDGIEYVLTNFDVIEKTLADVAKKFGEFMNGVIKTIKWNNIGKFIIATLKIIPETITALLRAINWEEVGNGITDFFKGFSFADKIKADTTMWSEIVTSLQTALLTADWGVIGQALSDTLIAWTAQVPTILSGIKWEELGMKIGEALRNVKWGEIFYNIASGISELVTGVFETIAGILEGAFNFDKGSLKPKDIMMFAAGLSLLVLAISGLSKYGGSSKTKDIKKSLSSIGDGFSSMMKGLGTAAVAIAVLSGIALVLKSLAETLTSFSQTGMSTGEGVTFIISLFGGLALAAIGLSLAFKSMDWKAMASGLVILAGISAVFLTLSMLLNSIAATGFTAGETMGILAGVMLTVIALIGTLALAAALLQSPMALAGLVLIGLTIVGILWALKETLPTILDACGDFINKIAPFVIKLVTVIGILINEVIKSLGTVLPPIIRSVGSIFKTIFNGVSNVINSVGNVIVRIMSTAANVVTKVLKSILSFINQLGPAINRFVDNAIIAVTKLVNFIVSSIEYLINTAIVKPINTLIRTINNNKIAEALGWQIGTLATVSIDRFAPRLSTGTNEIPNEGLYHLHPGEAVVPKKYNPALGNGGSEEMNAKLDTLINIMNNMNFTNIVNVGNKKLYEGQQAFNKTQQNKYGTINLY